MLDEYLIDSQTIYVEYNPDSYLCWRTKVCARAECAHQNFESKVFVESFPNPSVCLNHNYLGCKSDLKKKGESNLTVSGKIVEKVVNFRVTKLTFLKFKNFKFCKLKF